MDINWALTITFSIIGSIILSVIGNLITDPVKDWLSQRTLISRTKRINKLKKELDTAEKYYNDRTILHIVLGVKISEILATISFGLILSVALIALSPVYLSSSSNSSKMNILVVPAIIPFYAALIGSAQLYKLLIRVQKFDEYKARTEKRIAELTK